MFHRFLGVLMALMLTHFSFGQRVTVTVNVVAPKSTPAGTKLYITGNDSTLGNWNPDRVLMQQVGESLWTHRCIFRKDFHLELKITQGSWNKQAIYKVGEIPPNTQLITSRDTVITLRPIMWSDSMFRIEGGITGEVRYHRNLQGTGLNYPRDIIVWLPPSYGKDTIKRYPVLYMHDGQNTVDPTTSFSGYDWHMDEVGDSLMAANKIREFIMVGIYNTPDRMLEYAYNALGPAYLNFIVHQVKPLIDSTYRTMPDRANTAIMGSSLGGEISFLAAWMYPEIFSQAGCLSPVFPDSLINEVRNDAGPSKDIRLYIDNGGFGGERELLSGCERMLAALKSKGFSFGRNLEWFYDESADHSERAWAKRLWRPLIFLFGK